MAAQKYVPHNEASNSSDDDLKALKAKARAEDLSELLLSETSEDVRCGPSVHCQPTTAPACLRLRVRATDQLRWLTTSFCRPFKPEQVDAPNNMRWREFALVYVAYMGFLVSRKNYGFWLRPVISELGYAKGQAGLIGSTLEVTYGTCSFLNGVVVRAQPRAAAAAAAAAAVLAAARCRRDARSTPALTRRRQRRGGPPQTRVSAAACFFLTGGCVCACLRVRVRGGAD